jgi:hypothetical protein
MWEYVDEVQKLEHRFDGLKLEHILHGRNIVADELLQIVAKRLPVDKDHVDDPMSLSRSFTASLPG